ncbi:hypothetical protein ACJQWK_08836 [Exserohilum turcicum]
MSAHESNCSPVFHVSAARMYGHFSSRTYMYTSNAHVSRRLFIAMRTAAVSHSSPWARFLPGARDSGAAYSLESHHSAGPPAAKYNSLRLHYDNPRKSPPITPVTQPLDCSITLPRRKTDSSFVMIPAPRQPLAWLLVMQLSHFMRAVIPTVLVPGACK